MRKNDSELKISEADKTCWSEAPLLLVKGFLMGSADIIPGVSGGTMALILGIYTRLIHAIKSADLQFLKLLFTFKFKPAFRALHWQFLVMLLSGIGLAFFFFTRVVPLQLYMVTRPELIFGLFFGLILGSIYILIKAIESLNWKHGVFILIGTVIGFWVVTLVPTDTPESKFFVFLSGSIAICAMILPGISGSYILLILRKYDYILSQLADLGNSLEPVLVILTFIAGAVVGIALFSRFLSWLLDRHYEFTLAVLIGFLIGSLYVIWPYQNRTYQEIVTQTEVIEYTDTRAVELRNNPPDERQPTYQRLGKVLNAGAHFDELKEVELQTVKKKLIKTDPFVPFVTREDAGTGYFWSGVIGIVVGLMLVGVLDYLRAK